MVMGMGMGCALRRQGVRHGGAQLAYHGLRVALPRNQRLNRRVQALHLYRQLRLRHRLRANRTAANTTEGPRGYIVL